MQNPFWEQKFFGRAHTTSHRSQARALILLSLRGNFITGIQSEGSGVRRAAQEMLNCAIIVQEPAGAVVGSRTGYDCD